MSEVLALATGKTYNLVTSTCVTAHPAQAPYSKDQPEYVAPIMPGGTIEKLYRVTDIVECEPEKIYSYSGQIPAESYLKLVSYYEQRLRSFGYSHKNAAYRFYILKEYADVAQPFEQKYIQISKRLSLSEIPILRNKKRTDSSWRIMEIWRAVYQCDQKFFENRGLTIPKNMGIYFRLENLKADEKKNIEILYNDSIYHAYFSPSRSGTIKLFWDQALSELISAFQNISPTPIALFDKADPDVFTLDFAVGSDRTEFLQPTEWIVPCNTKVYNCVRAFNELICVDWHQNKMLAKVNVNDIVYIYESSPVQAITYQCIVNKVNVPELEIPDYDYYEDKVMGTSAGPFIELQCIREFDVLPGLTFAELRKHGVNGNIQGPLKISEELSHHLNRMVKEQNVIDRMTGSNMKFIGPSLERNVMTDEDEKTAPRLPTEMLFRIAQRRGTEDVKSVKATVLNYRRDPYIAEYAKRRANGICQLCGQPAPFTDANGGPYLESHHIIWLSEGGEDSVRNTVALCPNCHRKMHVVKSSEDVEKLKSISGEINN